ncbi:MAG: hypothetical protein EXR76_10480 [Myxococcales bacterium]|nr:hypothetical protein [Myxococcales bacterium]
MTETCPLSQRLRTTDLRMTVLGTHLDDERLAEVVGGLAPTSDEALHLAGCDDCLDVLVAAGEGLEAMGSSAAAALSLAPAPAPAPAAATAAASLNSPATAAAGLNSSATAAASLNSPATAAASLNSPATAAASRSTPPRLGSRWPRATVIVVSTVVAFGAAAAAGAMFFGSKSAAPTGSQPPVSAPSLNFERSTAPAVVEPVEVIASLAVGVASVAAMAPAVGNAEAPPRVLSARKASPSLRLDHVDREEQAFGRAPVNALGRGFGSLRLNARPPALAFIDDRPYGWTPLVDVRLQEGPHDIRLEYAHPDALSREERFRVVIPADAEWTVTRRNLRGASDERP